MRSGETETDSEYFAVQLSFSTARASARVVDYIHGSRRTQIRFKFRGYYLAAVTTQRRLNQWASSVFSLHQLLHPPREGRHWKDLVQRPIGNRTLGGRIRDQIRRQHTLKKREKSQHDSETVTAASSRRLPLHHGPAGLYLCRRHGSLAAAFKIATTSQLRLHCRSAVRAASPPPPQLPSRDERPPSEPHPESPQPSGRTVRAAPTPAYSAVLTASSRRSRRGLRAASAPLPLYRKLASAFLRPRRWTPSAHPRPRRSSRPLSCHRRAASRLRVSPCRDTAEDRLLLWVSRPSSYRGPARLSQPPLSRPHQRGLALCSPPSRRRPASRPAWRVAGRRVLLLLRLLLVCCSCFTSRPPRPLLRL